jgi:hypothetical protein
VQHGRPGGTERLDRELVQRARPGAGARDQQHRPFCGKPQLRARLSARERSRVCGQRPPDDFVLRRLPAVDRVSEEDPLDERRGEPVGETQMRVGFRHGGRDPPSCGREHHRAADEAPRAEHDVRLPPREDPVACSGRRQRVQDRVRLREPGPSRQAAHAKRVELEPGLRDEPRLGAPWRPGERHSRAAVAQRLPDREGGQHVSGCSPGRYQARWRVELRHRPRC